MIQRVGFPAYNNPLTGIPNFWRNALCDREAPPPNPSPFTGGQCAGVEYNLEFRVGFTVNSTGQVVPPDRVGVRNFLGDGPIRPIGSNEGNQFVYRNASTGQFMGAVNNQTNSNFTYAIYDLIRVDGLPDDCGDPDPEYEDLTPDDVTIDVDITYQNADGIDVTVPVVFVFARAQIDVDANITIPFTVNINGTVNVTGNLNLSGDVDINIGTAGNPPAPKDPRKGDCDDIALPVEPPPEDPTDSEQPERPDRSEEESIIGCLVTVTSLSNERASLIVQDENPDIYAPSLGHINFLCRVGQTSAGWTSDLPVKNRRNLIQCPWSLGAIAVRGTPQPGVTWELTPIYGYAGQPVEYVQ